MDHKLLIVVGLDGRLRPGLIERPVSGVGLMGNAVVVAPDRGLPLKLQYRLFSFQRRILPRFQTSTTGTRAANAHNNS